MNNTAKIGLLLPTVLNPATAILGIGLGLLWFLRDNEDDADVDTGQGNRVGLAALTEEKPLPDVELEADARPPEAAEHTSHATPEADQAEIIRCAMSELGKRSAAARAKRKTELQSKAE